MKGKRITLILIAFTLGPWMLWSGIKEYPARSRRLSSGVSLILSGAVLTFVSLRMRQGARKIAGHVEALCEPEYEYASVNAQEFSHLDLNWYNASQRWLQEKGFVMLGDEENLTFRRTSKGNRTLLRTMLGNEGACLAYLYHFKPAVSAGSFGGDGFKILELQNHFGNGLFICTSNAEAAGKLDSPPGVDALRMSANSTMEQVFAAHAQRVATFLRNNPGVASGRMNGLEDVHRVQNVLQKIKSAHRRQTGISKEELERLGGKRLDPEQLQEIHGDVKRLHQERHREAA